MWNDEPLRGCTKILLFVKLGTFAEKLAREVSGEVGGSMPENAVEDYRFARRVWSIALVFRQHQTDSGRGGRLTVRITIFLAQSVAMVAKPLPGTRVRVLQQREQATARRVFMFAFYRTTPESGNVASRYSLRRSEISSLRERSSSMTNESVNCDGTTGIPARFRMAHTR